MSRRRRTRFLAVLAGASLLTAAACSGDDDDGEISEDTSTEESVAGTEPADTTAGPGKHRARRHGAEDSGPATTEAEGGEPTGTVTNAQEQEFFAYNNNTSTTNAASNGLVLNKVLPDTFYYQGGDGALVMDENLLDSAEVTSEDPQIVEYVVNADAVWSDGDPIDCDDFYLSWISQNGVLKQLDDAGNPVLGEDGATPLLVFDIAGTHRLRADRVDRVLRGRQDDHDHLRGAVRRLELDLHRHDAGPHRRAGGRHRRTSRPPTRRPPPRVAIAPRSRPQRRSSTPAGTSTLAC